MGPFSCRLIGLSQRDAEDLVADQKADLPRGDYRHIGTTDKHALADVLGIGSRPVMEHGDWMRHVRAGEVYNVKVANTNMRRYFTLGAPDVLGFGHQPRTDGLGQLDYVVPGDEPHDEPERTAYRVALDVVKASEDVVARAYLMAYILVARVRASHDVKGK